jgi:hypothetical protein
MKEEYEVVKGIRFPKYSLKVVKYTKGEYGVVESFLFYEILLQKVRREIQSTCRRKTQI